jgi:hypothetical protein
MDSVFTCVENSFEVTPQVKECYNQHGYVIVRSLLSLDELDKLKKTLENDSEVLKHSFGRDDGSGRISRMALWNHPGKDITGMVARAEKVAGTVEKVGDSRERERDIILMCS